MNRGDFQQLAEEHLRHAKALLDAELYSGAYYMCGYVVECALKACICRNRDQFEFPTRIESKNAWSHDFKTLINVAELEPELNAARQADVVLDVNWKGVEVWEPDSRYKTHDQQEARALLEAISDPDHGVLSCIKRYW